MASVDILSDDDEMLGSPPAPVAPPAAIEGAPATGGAQIDSTPQGLQSMVVASMDLADSSDDELLPPAAAPAAEGKSAAEVTAPLSATASCSASPGQAGKAASKEPVPAPSSIDDSDDELLTTGKPPALSSPIPADIPATSNPAPAPSAKAPSSAAVAASKLADSKVASSSKAAKSLSSTKRPAGASGTDDPPAKQARTQLSAAGQTKKAAPGGKSEAKDKKLTKEEMEKQVLEYMQQQNRPYNSQNIFDNLHGKVPKASVQAILDSLCATSEVLVKEYGKIKVYLPSQAGTAKAADQDGTLQSDVDTAAAQLKELQGTANEVKKSVSQLRSRHAAAVEAKAAECESRELEQRAAELRATAEAGGARVDEQQVKATEESYRVAHAAWRKRKRLCLEALRTLSEASGAPLQRMLESYGVDTDEDCNQLMPPEFL